MKKKKKKKKIHSLSDFSRVAEAFVPELTEATFGRDAHARKTEIYRFALGSALRVC